MLQIANIFLDEGQSVKLRSLVQDYRGIWSVSLTDDDPAKVTPFKVHQRSDAVRDDQELVSMFLCS